MAGEMEEPLSISFQADSFHSGSISFGRFENEPLSWESRSPFSHNRYLEEVEKYSKPGSVIEKKAYFEAHFKKKGIRFPGSSVVHHGREHQTSGNNDMENEGYRDQSDNVNEVDHHDQFDKNSLDQVGYLEEFDYGNQGRQSDYEDEQVEFDYANESCQYGNENENMKFDNAIEGSHPAPFDKSSEGLEYLCEGEVIECEREGHGIFSSNAWVEAAVVNADIMVGNFPNVVEREKKDQSGIGYGNPLIYDEPEKEVKQNLNDSAVNVDASFKSIDSSPKSARGREADVAGSEDQKNLSPKFEASVEAKSTKPRLKSQVKPSPFPNKISNGTPKAAAKSQIRMERQSPGRVETEKLSSGTDTLARHALHKSPRKEGCETSNGKFNVESKSVKGGQSVKKTIEAQQSPAKRVEPVAHEMPSRLHQTSHSPKPDKEPVPAAFNFKSDERAERRKEFYMKLEEKMHAKEAEMNQVQARTQEKTEAEIKQLRKSLNFKAKPMPAFYNVAATPKSNGSKAASSNTRSTNIRTKSTGQGSGATGRLQSVTAVNNKTLSTSDIPQSTGEVHGPRVERSHVGFISTSADDNHSHPETMTQNAVIGKKEREKDGSNLQKNHTSESSIVTKDRKVDRRPKVGAHRGSSKMGRKNVRGVGITSRSGAGRLAVVAS